MNNKEKLYYYKNKYEGKIFINYKKCKYKVLQYINSKNIEIQFLDKYKFKTIVRIDTIYSGMIKNPYYPYIYGIGYDGKYYKNLGNKKKEYTIWMGMLARCYSKKYQSKNKTYCGCTVCESWHNFSNFYDWIIKQENYDKWKKKEWNIFSIR